MDALNRTCQNQMYTPNLTAAPSADETPASATGDSVSIGSSPDSASVLSLSSGSPFARLSGSRTAEKSDSSVPAQEISGSAPVSDSVKELQAASMDTALSVAGTVIGGPSGLFLGLGKLRVFLVRHGETTFNKEGKLQGQIDVPLSDTGTAQADDASRRLMDHLKTANVAGIFCSDLGRTRQTAAPFIKALEAAGKQVPVHYMAELREMNFGAWEGKTPQQIKDEAGGGPSPYEQWQKNPRSIDPPGGENIDVFFNRTVGAIEDSIRKSLGPADAQDDRSVVIFAHGGVIAMMLNHINGRDPGGLLQFKIPNASGPRLEYLDGAYQDKGLV